MGQNISVSSYETQIMNSLNWDLRCITAMEFIEIFVSQRLVVQSEDIASLNTIIKPSFTESFEKYLNLLSDLCLKQCEFMMMDTLILASGIIAASRKLIVVKKM